MSKRTKFNPLWKSDPVFKNWLEEDKSSIHAFRCKVCQSRYELANMGKPAVSRHMTSKKHISLMQSRAGQSSSLLASWTQSQPCGTRPSSSVSSQDSSASNQSNAVADTPSNNSTCVRQGNMVNPSIDNWASSEDVMKAEIMWNMHCTVNHLSYRSNNRSF